MDRSRLGVELPGQLIEAPRLEDDQPRRKREGSARFFVVMDVAVEIGSRQRDGDGRVWVLSMKLIDRGRALLRVERDEQIGGPTGVFVVLARDRHDVAQLAEVLGPTLGGDAISAVYVRR